MARLARAVVPGVPHHVTQRGNRRQDTFFCDEDFATYKALMAEWCAKCAVEVWAYCLMTNHVHLILVPSDETGLARAVGEAHRRYTRHVNGREGWTGYLWQGRFSSYPMDEAHLLAAAAYVERNPVQAGLTKTAREYPWSSARAHLSGSDDGLVCTAPLLERYPDWAVLLRREIDDETLGALRAHKGTGRPLGTASFITALEGRLGRPLIPSCRNLDLFRSPRHPVG